MKKLLIFFIVLSLATSTRATAVYVDAVYIWGSGHSTNEITVAPYATVTVYLVCNIGMTGIGDTDQGHPGWWITADAGITLPSNGTFDPLFDVVISDDLSRLYAITTSVTEFIAAGEPFFWFDVTAPMVYGDYEITVNTDENWDDFWDTVGSDRYIDLVSGTPLTITVVPEPMTIALLGLGGLIISRR